MSKECECGNNLFCNICKNCTECECSCYLAVSATDANVEIDWECPRCGHTNYSGAYRMDISLGSVNGECQECYGEVEVKFD